MNSLRDLNTQSLKGLQFQDPRPSELTFDRDTPDAQVVVSYPNENFELTPGINISSMINSESKFLTLSNINTTSESTSGLQYEVTLYTAGNAASITDHSVSNIANYVTFANIPINNAGYTPLTNVGTGGMWANYGVNDLPNYTNIKYTVYGIKNIGDWDLVKSPTIAFDIASLATNKFKSEIKGNTISKIWYTTVNPVITNELTTPSDAYYSELTPGALVSGVPTVTPSANTSLQTSSYTCRLSGSDSQAFGNLTTSGTLGGTSSWSNNHNELTLTGNAAQINSHLTHLYYNAANDYAGTWVLNYSLYNPVTEYTSYATQLIKNSDDDSFSEPLVNFYDNNTISRISGTPAVTYSATNDYTITVTSNKPDGVHSLTTSGTGGSSSWNSGAKTLTITGTKTQVNSHLATLDFEPVDDYRQPMVLTYSMSNPTGPKSSTQTQSLFFNDANPAVTNLAVNRSFISNTANQNLFLAEQPQIIEDAVGDPTYTLVLTSPAGEFGFSSSEVTDVLSVSGTRDYINEQIYSINFYPYRDVSGTQTLNINILRDAEVIADQTVAFIGSVRTTPIDGTTYKITSSQTITPSFELVRYLDCDIMLVSGGGGGGYASTGSGAGGGAGGVYAVVGYQLPIGPLSIVVGAAGTVGATSNTNGYAGGESSIASGATTLLSARRGYGGGGTTYTNGRDGGAFNGITYSITGLADSVGTTAGGFWWHKGGIGQTSTGAGGGGARATAGGGSALSLMDAANGSYSGDGITSSDFYLVSETGYSTVATGGGGDGGGGVPTAYGHGGRGSDVSGGISATNGVQGVVVIKFY